MKLKLMMVMGIGLLPAQVHAEEQQVFRSPMDQVNYGIGVEVVRNFKNQGIEVDLDMVIKGMKDGLSGKILVSEKELRKTITAFQTELRQKQAMTRKFTAQDNRKKGDAFLAENKTKEGVVTLPSGLQYKILRAADGKKATDADTVECNYRGTLIDGTEFDSSYESGKPAAFRVSEGVILGWKEALKLIPVGSKWQFFIPPQLAYGDRGAGRQIGPGETLIFEVELLAIK
jgi:FKBP-type peptidyl-prolyl cis-trans isomerase